MASFAEAREYLSAAALRGSRLGLGRITELCRLLGDPQNAVPVVHVAGTNGKGSFGAMLTAILTAAGYKVGSFSSPALTGITDSFRINGAEITGEDFGELICGIIPACESMDDKPTEFEVLTAAAYRLFAEKGCDIAVVECGMGGATDSTNVLASPLLSVITNVAIDHTSFLGDTVETIARIKAGIIKPGRPVLFGGNDERALGVIGEISASLGSELTVTDHSRVTLISSGILGTRIALDGSREYATTLTGEYQQYNLANVLTAVELLRREGLSIPENAVRSGLEAVRWHGRFEVVSREPLIIFDGAHNPDGIAQAARSIEKYFPGGKIALLIGVMADKEYDLYPEMLGKFIDRAFTVKPDNPRALDSDRLAASFTAHGIPASPFTDLAQGVRCAAEYAKSSDIPLIALGSLYMYHNFIKALE